MDSDDTRGLPLREAMLRWCDPELLASLRAAETALAMLRPVPEGRSYLEGASLGEMRARSEEVARQRAVRRRPLLCWQALIADFRGRLERGEVVLRGVQIKPTRQTEVTPIPGQWAADFRFDLEGSAIDAAELRYVLVRASLPESGDADGRASVGAAGPAGILAELRPEDLPALSDEMVLALLEENARRVVESPDARLFPPGKISLMPLILRKMEARAAAGELLPELASEAAWLATWIKGKAPSHQTPTAATIKNSLRSRYRTLKPRSKPTIRPAGD